MVTLPSEEELIKVGTQIFIDREFKNKSQQLSAKVENMMEIIRPLIIQLGETPTVRRYERVLNEIEEFERYSADLKQKIIEVIAIAKFTGEK